MKQSPQDKKLNEILRSSKLVAGGFMGIERRNFCAIIDADATELAGLGLTQEQVVLRLGKLVIDKKAGSK